MTTETETTEDYREIPLTQGQAAKVSPHRYEELSQLKWFAVWSKFTNSYYAYRNTTLPSGKKRMFSMHRQILGLKHGDGKITDHKRPGDTLNNTDGNLRIATRGQQNANNRKRKDNTSGYKGVSYDSRVGVYYASVQKNGEQTILGSRRTAKEAHEELYIPAIQQMHGDFACSG